MLIEGLAVFLGGSRAYRGASCEQLARTRKSKVGGELVSKAYR